MAAFVLTAPACGTDLNYDIIFRDAQIIDGTGAAPLRGDLAVRNGRVAALGQLDAEATAPKVFDAAGRYLAPGFIDVHTHCEGDLLERPEAANFVRMGVTTIVTGNCGSSYTTLGDALTSHARSGIGINLASLVGHNSIRREVMDNAARDPSTTEIEAMVSLVGQAMKDGAFGISTGLIYTPGIWAKTDEIKELAREAARHGGIYVSHMRSEGTSVTEAISEALEIGRYAGCPVQLSHFKITSPKRFGESTVTTQMVRDARRRGQDVTVDQYVYTASSTGIKTMLPDWAVEGTTTDVARRLAAPELRETILNGIVEERRAAGRPDLSYAVVAFCRAEPEISGKNILELARERKGDTSWRAQAEVVADIMTSGGAGMVFHSMAEEDVRRIAAFPFTMFASDSGVREFGKGVPHPRGYGNNARVLSNYVRALKVLSVEEAVRKMSSLPAWRFGLADRGVIRPGAFADLVLFDLARVHDPATFEKPHAYAEGFDYVLVNGVPVVENGEVTGARSGKVLYGPGYQRPRELKTSEAGG